MPSTRSSRVKTTSSSGAGRTGRTLASVPTAEAGESELDTLARLAIDIVIEAYDHPQRAVFFSVDPAAVTR
jgi:hypothetical protein